MMMLGTSLRSTMMFGILTNLNRNLTTNETLYRKMTRKKNPAPAPCRVDEHARTVENVADGGALRDSAESLARVARAANQREASHMTMMSTITRLRHTTCLLSNSTILHRPLYQEEEWATGQVWEDQEV